MRKFKSIAAAFLAMSMVIPFTGCSSESTDESNKETIVLRILENDTAKEKGYLDVLINEFNEAYKDKGIQAVDANMDEYSNLAENGPYGYGPDVLYQANDKLMTYAEDKHLMALNIEDFDCCSTTPKEAFEAFELVYEGKTYTCGVPVNVQEPMLFYRADMMPSDWETSWDDNKNGVADFFENWNDLYAYSKYLRENDTSANKDAQYGYMSSFNNLYLNSNFLLSYGAYVFGKNEDGSLNSKDIGFSEKDTSKGLMAMIQFSKLMNEGCIDDTITSNRYEKLASGNYFVTISTPDTYTLFVEKLALKYQEAGLDADAAKAKATENVKMIELPALMPKDGNLEKDSSSMTEDDYVKTVVMGGVNGYGISSYTKHKEACIEFVNFATSKEMIAKRAEMLGIAPTRSDVVETCGETANTVYNNLIDGRISLMPSIKAVDQIWTPIQTLMGDIAKDAFRTDAEKKYGTEDDIKFALDKASQNIYDAIYTLAD